MTQVNHIIEDDPLHTVKDVVAKDDHVAEDHVYAKLSRKEQSRIRFWGRLARFTEARWLEANGWERMKQGWWGLPCWHPKLGLGPYEQNHAANSQRHYNMRGLEVRPKPPLPKPSPHFFAASKYIPKMLLCYSVLFTATGSMRWNLSLHDLVALLVVVAAFGYSVYLSRQYGRDLQFEEAERLLRSTRHEGPPHHGNGRHRNHRG